MIVYPAIDMLGGQAVRLGSQGDFAGARQVAPSPLEAAKKYVAAGAQWLHLVDLDGARTGVMKNLDQIRRIAASTTVKIQASGGIRDFETAEALVEAGASRIVVGTAAVRDPTLLARLVDRHADELAVAIDAKGGMVATDGWTAVSDLKAADLAQRLAGAGVASIVFTNVSVDGTMGGVDVRGVEEVARAFGGGLIYSGGVASLDDIRALVGLRHRGVRGVIVGSALYKGAFTLPQALEAAKPSNAR
ncbi:MAG: 1-(5-phosphoribosyl)-5-[(5-phosphoribosylamino)methylideneamino]imidazole-4-carboxamide isomerase [Chloroflexi bacterium]|nr:1-(5-phosphoribosyl)-5-[(5-phosphoribosylamino)methylideneamino]imidazole-4-carboxamide isomerase [Chloroflexota bacterium]